MKSWLVIVLTSAHAFAAALEWEEGNGFRAAALPVPREGRPGFTRLWPGATGVSFTNFVTDAQLARNQILEVGSGVALGDYDRDGRTDIYLCSMGGANRLYRNLGGWKFEETTPSVLACDGQFSTGAVFADVNGDAALDLLVNGIGVGTRLFLNGANGFQEKANSGLSRGRGSTSMALADIDGDGALDLYVANYHTRTFKDSPPGLEVEAGYVGGEFVIKPPGLFLPLLLKSGSMNLFERGESDFLYRNDGAGNFSPVDWTSGAFLEGDGKPLGEAPKEWGLAVAFRDLNRDGAPDIYVCNDFFHSPDHIWLNDGTGKFRAAPAQLVRQTSMSSMAVDFADLNRDGHEDFMVLDMMSRDHGLRHRQRGSQIHLQVETPTGDPGFRPEYPRNMVYLNQGDGTYAEIAQFCGLEASEWSWSIAFLDVDLDGLEDVLVTNGNLRDANNADLSKNRPAPGKPKFPPLKTKNLAFRNRGDLKFEENSSVWGFDHFGISHGMALGDLDGDGDLDLVVNDMREAAGLYRNDGIAPRVTVRLIGRPPNVQGTGARIELLGGAVAHQAKEVISGGRYLSGDDPVRAFAAGAKEVGMTLKVRWRSGVESRVEGVRANYVYEIHETAATRSSDAPAPPESPFFDDISEALRHPHQENAFNDFERQPTLSRQLSRSGPGLAWRDLDNDGWEDLIVGGARNGHSVIYLNNGGKSFKPLRRREALEQDQTTLLAIRGSSGVEIVAGAANYENPSSPAGTVIRYDLQTGAAATVVLAQPWSVGPLSLGFLGEKLALFVGGRVKSGRYPEAVPSQLYRLEGDTWRLDPANSAALSAVGMVNGSTWADLDGDGQVELILACDWGPIRVFHVAGGKLRETTETLGLANFRGLWNGVGAGDFDGDGRLDLLASNWGSNTRYQRHRSRPVRLYYGDWQGFGQVELLEAYYEPVREHYAPFVPLDALRTAFPVLAEKFQSFGAYANASIETIAAVPAQDIKFLEADWFETTLFLNRGTRFEARPLPFEAQLAPAFGVAIADFDGDGAEDAFLAQNFFAVDGESSRLDAGRGLWLRGDGAGNLQPVPARFSGVALYGEQRGAALADFDRDGRIDLAVGQNNGRVGLFRNVRGRPGLRVHLRGAPWNPDAIGAVIRARRGGKAGSARAIQAGSGYWSQESLVQVLSGREPVTSLTIRWPGGRLTEHSVQAGQGEISLSEPAR